MKEVLLSLVLVLAWAGAVGIDVFLFVRYGGHFIPENTPNLFDTFNSALWGVYITLFSVLLGLVTFIKSACVRRCQKSRSEEIFPSFSYTFGFLFFLITASSFIGGTAFVVSCISLTEDYPLVVLATAASFSYCVTIVHIVFWVISARDGLTSSEMCATTCLANVCHYGCYRIDREGGHKSYYRKTGITFFLLAIVALSALMLGTGWAIESAINEFNDADAGTDAEFSGPCRKYATAAVASASKTCSEVGKNVMKDGGNAADAAVAVSFCLGVVEFQSSGLGGGGFLLHYDKSKRSMTSIDFRSTAPESARTNTLDNKSLRDRPELFIAVPGELKGLRMLWEKYGSKSPRLGWQDLIAPSIKLARDGFTVSKDLAKAAASFNQFNQQNKVFDPLLNLIRPNGNPIQEGTTLKRPYLALTLAKISQEKDALYQNEFTEKVIEDLPAGSLLTQNDFQEYSVHEESAVPSTSFSGKTMHGTPLPASGVVQQLLENVMKGYKMNENDRNSALAYHRLVESFKLGFARRNVLGDLNHDPNKNDPTKSLVNLYAKFQEENYANQLQKRIDDNKTFNDVDYYTYDLPIITDYSKVEKDDNETSTTHIAVIDQDGKAVSLTTSVGYLFGSGVLSESTGILLNSDMIGFSFIGSQEFFDLPYNPNNLIEGGKRPLSSMCPTIVVNNNDNSASLVVGGAGGSRIITAVSLAIIRHFFFSEEVCESVNDERLHHQLVPNKVFVETEFSKEIISELRRKGHTVDVKKLGTEDKPTAVHAVGRTSSGGLLAACDKRLSGEPAGW
ncbi:glutathione hydrolase 1 proenzyme-like [Oscarella lobularis]|uniref:glutathione hydrolase 1 proenzyme-like n=1 Tax=Oscarella lobularis TaxID=121494 RepID=UPI0033134AD7